MLSRLADLIVFGLLPLSFGLAMMPARAAEQVLTGEVTYRERMALPPQAIVTVRLSDVSLADAPDAQIAVQEISPAGQVPVKFRLSFDPSVLRLRAIYALQARIMVDNRLWFITDQRYTPNFSKEEQPTLVLKRVAQ